MAEAADFQGTSASPGRRWLRRAGALAAAVPLLAGLLQLAPAASAQDHASAPGSPAAKAEPTGSRTVDVTVNSLTPNAPTDDDTLTVTGTVTNKSRHTVTDAFMALRTGPLLGGRAAVDTAAEDHAFGTISEGVEIPGKYQEKIGTLRAGVPHTFSIRVPVKDLDLGPDGVYQLGVTVSGQSSVQPWVQPLGIQRTFLPWQPDAAGTKTKTTYLWPLISSTHITAETGSNEEQTPVFHDDSLAREIAPGGRLQQLVALGADLDVTWVIDPDLLASVDAMTRGYDIEGPGDTTVHGTNQGVAKDWLNDLESAVTGAKVVALPFADPDLASLAHTGKAVSGSLSHLQDATDVASSTVGTILHVKPDTDFAWPVDGALDSSVVDVATSAGADAVIARSDTFEERGNLPYTPTAARPVGGGTTAVVADSRLSTAFQGDMTRADTTTLAVQKFLAQSLMIQEQAPDKQRSIVVAPQRMPTAGQAQAMAAAVHALQDSGWSQPEDLAAAADADPDPGATTQVPRSYPARLRGHDIPSDDFVTIQNTQRKLTEFKDVLTDPSRVVTPFGRAMDREMSTSWRGKEDDARSFRGGVASYLDRLTQSVHLIRKSETKLSGRSATIPVTVQNNLLQGVDHLMLRLTSSKPARLKIGDHPYTEQPVQVSGGHSQSVKFTTTANANGPVPVVAQLYTEDGRPYGGAVTFNVNVTEVTPAVMLVIAGGLLLLVLAGFRMYTQRKRAAARQAAEDGGGSGGGPATGDAPSDGGPDADEGREPDDGAGGTSDGADTARDRAHDETAARDRAHDEAEETPPSSNPDENGPVGAFRARSRADDSQQPGDQGADTAPETADVSGPGERVDR
ncbi:DUF6049 family protein [Streptomyces sp. NPDC050560]|uniref:DUF6049 family protein n=1 Tax=Streptomyces sp. NPDC050560 TaxID=3365630 RepID=UPI00379B54C4